MLRPHLSPFGAWVKANPCRRITMTFLKEGRLYETALNGLQNKLFKPL
jgi:hypothetical protein